MPLPADNSNRMVWPPKEASPMLSLIVEWALWYTGSPSALASYYGNILSTLPGTRFWRRVAAGKVSSAIHVPIAADIAAELNTPNAV
jgi:hypothetical protein